MAANFKVISSLLNKWKFEPPVFLVLPKIQPWSVLIMFLDFREFQPYVLINVVLIKKRSVSVNISIIIYHSPVVFARNKGVENDMMHLVKSRLISLRNPKQR